MPAEPLTVARYLAVRANSGASIATLRLATSAIAEGYTNGWAKLESPCRDPGMREALKGWGRRLSKPQRQAWRPHRRCVGRDPAHRGPKPRAFAAAASKRPSRLPKARPL